ncbi:hypothetical protein T11_18264 [Trichinella zimbabwensis]|uniref:Retrovirus-related Pol polyprotein from transposon TNT 1-94 n=1 Tax=Trichinella zimbabwensis TaxID=268475 RepID=A0A0V1HDM5_9BILA|nr:hypothetical protein T11_18264 [Trichinella zimbabwensis]
MSVMATDSDPGMPVIAKLNSSNYQLWKLKMKGRPMGLGEPSEALPDTGGLESKRVQSDSCYMSHGGRRLAYPSCATESCPGNVADATAIP